MQTELDFTHFHNSNLEEGEALAQSEEKAKRQEDIILEFFRNAPYSEFSAEDIREIWVRSGNNRNVPITSFRRSVTNLCNQGAIVKTGNQKLGSFGKKIFTWKLKISN